MLRRGKRIKSWLYAFFFYLIIHSADFMIKMIVMMIAICVIYVTLAFSPLSINLFSIVKIVSIELEYCEH